MSANSNQTVVSLTGFIDRGKCRYCKETDSSNSACFIDSTQMSVEDCQLLYERGWRRSGNAFYKPTNESNCCVCYPIRCDALNFRLSKSHRKILTTFVNYMNNDIHEDEEVITFTRQAGDEGINLFDELLPYTSKEADDCIKYAHTQSLLKQRLDRLRYPDSGICLDDDEPLSPAMVTEKKVSVSEQRSGSSKRRRWIALQLRMRERSERENVPYEDLMRGYLERRQMRLAKNQPKSMEHYLSALKPNGEAKHFIETRLVPVKKSTPELEDILRTEFKLFQRYSAHVHGSSVGENEFDSFVKTLVDSPLIYKDTKCSSKNGVPAFGSYHHQYWLDGEKLIGVGVIDILPSYVSSSYYFYDPDYEFLRLGSLSSLFEIKLVREVHSQFGPHSSTPNPAFSNFCFYTMGFYIHTSSKMNYKGLFTPSYLACPDTYTWRPIESCRRLLDMSPYTRLAPKSIPSLPVMEPFAVLKRLQYLFLRSSNEPGDEAVCMPMIELSNLFLNKQATCLATEWVDLVGEECLDGRFLVEYVW